MIPPRIIVTDIEGTTTPISFVRDVLFPYARAQLPVLLRSRADDPEVAAELHAVRAAAPGLDPLAALQAWMDADAKITPLKALQGIIWRDGYRNGDLRGALYPDVAPILRDWAGRGVRLAVYSSGSVEAQRLLFGHSEAGDLTPLFSGWFDTRTGGKREAASYAAIARTMAAPPETMLFLSDMAAELDAARDAGMRTCQVLRAADGTVAALDHQRAEDFTLIPAWLHKG